MKRLAGICMAGIGLTIAVATARGEVKTGGGGTPLERDRVEGVSPCDWTAFYAAPAKDGLRLAYRCAGPIDFNRGAAYCVYLDADGRRDTGFRGGEDNFPIGADYLLQGITLYRYTGDDGPGRGVTWSWSAVGEVPFRVDGAYAEFTLSPALLELHGATLHAFLIADNTADGVGGSTNDEMPDGALRRGGGGKFIRIKLR
ncbi:MAG TPA: hypothetical protein PKE12_02530 [Kiritimatiellia bacterium]|nr:hypothetical protein [Kiritimatiellia bacterium]